VQVQGDAPAKVVGLSPNVAMAALMAAVFCCCVPMNMPMQHIVAFCGDVGISSQHGAAMLSVLLGSAFLARQFWGWMATDMAACGRSRGARPRSSWRSAD